MTFLLELRDTAKLMPDQLVAQRLRDIADRVDRSLNVLHDEPTTDNMIALNGWWAIGYHALKAAKIPSDEGPAGGSLHGVELQRLAA